MRTPRAAAVADRAAASMCLRLHFEHLRRVIRTKIGVAETPSAIIAFVISAREGRERVAKSERAGGEKRNR